MSPGPEHPVRLELHAREPFAESHPFPGIGAYEVLTATAIQKRYRDSAD